MHFFLTVPWWGWTRTSPNNALSSASKIRGSKTPEFCFWSSHRLAVGSIHMPCLSSIQYGFFHATGFIFVKSQKNSAHIHFVSAYVTDHTCKERSLMSIPKDSWSLHMMKDPWDCLWPQHVGWARSGDPKEWCGGIFPLYQQDSVFVIRNDTTQQSEPPNWKIDQRKLQGSSWGTGRGGRLTKMRRSWEESNIILHFSVIQGITF